MNNQSDEMIEEGMNLDEDITARDVRTLFKQYRDEDYTYKEILEILETKHKVKNPSLYIEMK